jgi:hypothetical protein
MIESYSFDQLLAWVNSEASDPQPHVLVVATKSKRHGFIHQSAREARILAMTFQCFDPDLMKFEEHRPATPEEIARDPIKGKLLFEELL